MLLFKHNNDKPVRTNENAIVIQLNQYEPSTRKRNLKKVRNNVYRLDQLFADSMFGCLYAGNDKLRNKLTNYYAQAFSNDLKEDFE